MRSPRHSISLTLPERILASVTKDAATGCWTWARSVDRNGYGHLHFQRRMWIAHRTAYEQFVGPIPNGMTLDHVCRNKRCVNPAHLEPVTQLENVRRYYAAQTHCKNNHEYTQENTIRYRNGRMCRACKRASGKRSYEKCGRARRKARRQ